MTCSRIPKIIHPTLNSEAVEPVTAGPENTGASWAKPPTAIDAAEMEFNQFAVRLARSLRIRNGTSAKIYQYLGDRS